MVTLYLPYKWQALLPHSFSTFYFPPVRGSPVWTGTLLHYLAFLQDLNQPSLSSHKHS